MSIETILGVVKDILTNYFMLKQEDLRLQCKFCLNVLKIQLEFRL